MQGERLGEDTTAGKIEGLARLREIVAYPSGSGKFKHVLR